MDVDEEADAKVCVLHTLSNPSKANIILFHESTLKKCQEAELVHKSRANWHTSVNKDIVLPSNPNGYSGYHAVCYRKYTAVSSESKKAAASNQPAQSTPADGGPSGSGTVQEEGEGIHYKLCYV